MINGPSSFIACIVIGHWILQYKRNGWFEDDLCFRRVLSFAWNANDKQLFWPLFTWLWCSVYCSSWPPTRKPGDCKTITKWKSFRCWSRFSIKFNYKLICMYRMSLSRRGAASSFRLIKMLPIILLSHRFRTPPPRDTSKKIFTMLHLPYCHARECNHGINWEILRRKVIKVVIGKEWW